MRRKSDKLVGTKVGRVLWAGVVFAGSASSALLAEPFTVDDLLAMESFDHAAIDPSGTWLLFEKLRRYDQINDYSYRAYAQHFSGHQIWRVDLEGSGEPELLPGLSPEPSSYIESFSQDGSFLAFYQYERGALKLGVYNMHTDEASIFERAPEYQRTGRHRPAWVSDHELIFPAVPRGEQPRMPTFRAGAARSLTDAWRGAFAGDQVTAQVFRTSGDRPPTRMLEGDLILANINTGDIRSLAPGRFSDIQVSPDRMRVAALAESEAINAEADLRSPGFERLHLLTIVDLAAGTSTSPAPDLEFLPGTISWDVSGRYMTAFGWPLGDSFRSGAFQVIDLHTGRVRPAGHQQIELMFRADMTGFYVPQRPAIIDGDAVVFARLRPDVYPSHGNDGAAAADASEPHWFRVGSDSTLMQLSDGLSDVSGELVYKGGDFITVLAAGGLYRIDGDGRVTRLTPEIQGTPSAVPLSPYGHVLDALGFDRNAPEILLQSTRTENSELVVRARADARETSSEFRLPAGDHGPPIAASSSAQLIVREALNGPVSTLQVEGPTLRQPLEIAHANERLQNTQFGSWHAFEYPLPQGGELVRSCILLPVGYNASAPPPLIVEVYPNSRPNCDSRTPSSPYPFAQSPDIWAGKGFAYARLATPPNHIRRSEGPIAGLPSVIDAGTREVIRRGWVDPERVVLFGTSQGGISALFVAAHSDLFAGTIATHSWSDLFGHYFEGAGMYSYAHGEAMAGNANRYESTLGSDFNIGRNPFVDPEVYVSNSPVYLAPNIQSPVFLMSTDMDIFSMSQFDKMYGAILRSGGNAVYIRYLGEGHALSSPANIRDYWERIDEFVRSTLNVERD